jgi:hypothetical protein
MKVWLSKSVKTRIKWLRQIRHLLILDGEILKTKLMR